VTNHQFTFLAQLLKNPRSIGAIAPSSKHLTRAMLAPIDFTKLRTLVEFGPGTGAMTEIIQERIGKNQNYLGIELNETFCAVLRHKFPHLNFVNRSACDLGEILKEQGLSQVDAIICGLPWASLPLFVQQQTIEEMLKCLAPGGIFVTFAYVQGTMLPGAFALRRRLRGSFKNVTTTKIVWRNFPPAFAYVCQN